MQVTPLPTTALLEDFLNFYTNGRDMFQRTIFQESFTENGSLPEEAVKVKENRPQKSQPTRMSTNKAEQ
jgi:hypothetical protein